jgi:hypothetical protein
MSQVHRCDVCGKYAESKETGDLTEFPWHWFTLERGVGIDVQGQREVCSVGCAEVALTEWQRKNEVEYKEAEEAVE